MTSSKNIYDLYAVPGLRIRNGGFTLIELLIVIAILGTLIGIAVPISASYVQQAKIAKAKVEIRSIETEILAFYAENNRFPSSLAEIGLQGFKDPYGNTYQYMPASDKAGKAKMRKDHNLVPVNTDFDLYSMGKDGDSKPPFTAKASIDDIVRANNGQFIGLVSDY